MEIADNYSALAAGIAHGLSRKLGLKISIRPGANPHTDTDSILVLPPPASNSEQDLAAWHGFCDHECGHALYTHKEAKADLAPTIGSMLNLLEDTHINARLAREYRGTGSNLKASYQQIARDLVKAKKPISRTGSVCMGAMAGLDPAAYAGLTLPDVDREAYAAGEAWGRLHADTVRDRATTRDLIPLAHELAALTKPKPSPSDEKPPPEKKPEPEPKPKPKQKKPDVKNEPDDVPPEGESAPEEGEESEPEEGEESAPEEGEESEPEESEESESEPSNSGDPGEPEEGEEGEGEPEEGEEGEGEPEEGEEAPNSTSGELSEDGENPLDLKNLGERMAHATKDRMPHMPETAGIEPLPPTYYDNDPPAPLSAALATLGKGLAADLRAAVQVRCKSRRIGDQEEGNDLDDDALADVANRRPDVRPFQTLTMANYPDTAVLLIVDGSGSMDATNTHDENGINGTMWQAAAGAAHALASGLAIVPRTQLAVWTNNKSDKIEHGPDLFSKRSTVRVMLPWNRKPDQRDLSRWSHTYAGAGNECWGTCVRAAIRELLTRRAKRKICVLISDGDMTHFDCPDRRNVKTSDLWQADQLAQKHGIEVYGVAWGRVASWNKTLPDSRQIAARDVMAPSREWLRDVAKLLLKKGKT